MTLATQALHAHQFTANIATVPVAIDFSALPEASQLFVVEYGLKQYIQDGAAVSKKDSDGNEKSEQDIANEKREGVEERVANLQAGEFTRRSTAVKLTPEEKHRNDVVMDGLRKAAAAVGKPLPTRTGKKAEPEKLDRMIAGWYAKHQVEIDKEVARRMKASEKAIDLTGLDELFA